MRRKCHLQLIDSTKSGTSPGRPRSGRRPRLHPSRMRLPWRRPARIGLSIRCLDPLLDVVRPLAGTELDDAKVGKSMRAERVLLDDRFDLLPTVAHRQDDPAIARDLSPRDQEVAGGIVFLEEPD